MLTLFTASFNASPLTASTAAPVTVTPVTANRSGFIKTVCGVVLLLSVVGGMFPQTASAQLTPEHRRELAALRREVAKASSLVRRKDFDEADKLLTDSEAKVRQIMATAGVEEQDAAIAGILKAIDLQKKVLERGQNPGAAKKEGGVSFSKEVAPILAANCTSCHSGETPRGGLKLDTFAGMKQGGTSGPLLVPGNAQRSLLAYRLVAPGQQRMPRGEDPLAPAEIAKIAEWIMQGARYDHTDENTVLSDLGKAETMKKVDVAKPEGNETVSFKDDIAPMLVTFCLRCHSGANPASGFSVETFEKILIGGDSGEVLIPGKLEDSRLFRLTGGLENPRMPQGQARITRKNYDDLKAWITEGIKFDGTDPKQPLLQMVPTEDEKMAAQLASMSDEEFQKHRQERGETHWRRTLSSAKPISLSAEHFLLMGNVDEARLGEVAGFAEAGLKQLQEKFGLKTAPVWRGKLAIYVFKDRYDYDEFNRSVENREPAQTLFGHGRVTDQFGDAYVAVLDTGNVSSATQPALKWTLFKSLVSAYLQINAKARPNWLLEGAGWTLADASLRLEDYERNMQQSAISALSDLRRPEDLFQNGTFAPDATEHVGFVVTRFLLRSGSQEQFRQFARQILDGRNINDACRSVYNATPNNLATGLRRALQ